MTEIDPARRPDRSFLVDGGELGALIAAFDWSSTPIGAIDGWPGSLKTTIGLILRSPVPIVTLWGEDGIMIYNDAYSVFAGGRHPRLLGSKVREGWGEIADFNDNVMRVGLAGGTLAYQDQELTLDRNGVPAPVWMNLDYSPVLGEGGKPTGVIAIVVETTAKVRAERAVRASEAQFRTLAQAIPNHVWTALPSGRIDWFNDQVYDYTGAAADELSDSGWTRILHPDDLPCATRLWDDALSSGEVYEVETRIRRADGVYRWHIARAVPLRDEGGEITRWIGTNTDIEDQKAAVQALANLNATLERQVAERTADRDRMWRLSTDIMLVANFDATIAAINPAWTESLGWAGRDVLGRSFLDLVHPDDRAATLAEVGRLSEGLKTFRFENRYQRKDGGYSLLSWTAVPDESFIHAVGRDITAEREAADALRRTETALQQAQKMEAIGQLTGGVAHDFNNLLQVVAGNLQLLHKDVAGNERAERRLANALAGVGRGARLASQLLAFGRRQALEPKVVNIGRFVTGMDDMLRRALGEAVEIETAVSGGLWNAFVDPTQIETALLNLAINARDAMDGTGRLTIEVGNAFLDDAYARTHADVAPGQYVVLAVTDTGGGMTPDVLAQVFEPFFSTKPEGKGTGLGLSMVYGFVKQSGGHVKIYSEPGQGTTVKLYFPRVTQTEDVVTVVDAGPATGGTETILVAEDDEEVRATVVEMLGELGYRVLKAKDAASALTVIESGVPIDLLFTDVVMPGPLKSPELARKARERVPGIAVLFTSGYTENAIVHGGRLDAGVELLSKPYSREALARKLRHVLANQAQRNRVTASQTAPVPPVAAPERPPAGTGEGAALSILLVEDDALIRMNSAELLQDLGHSVVEAGSAEEALAALQGGPVDVLVTDLGLPGLSGAEFAVKAREVRPAIGIVFATGRDEAPELGGEGATVLLRKPYDGTALAAALRAVRGGGEGWV